MEKKTTYPDGIRVFAPNEKSPEWVKASIVITPKTFLEWIKQNPDLLKDYKGDKQIRLQLKSGTKGLYVEVDTWEAKSKSDLPF